MSHQAGGCVAGQPVRQRRVSSPLARSRRLATAVSRRLTASRTSGSVRLGGSHFTVASGR